MLYLLHPVSCLREKGEPIRPSVPRPISPVDEKPAPRPPARRPGNPSPVPAEGVSWPTFRRATLLPIVLAMAGLASPWQSSAQERPPKALEQAMEEYVLEQLEKEEVIRALLNAANDLNRSRADIERGIRAALEGVEAADQLLSGGFDVVLGGSAIAMTGGTAAVGAAFGILMGALTDSPEALIEKRLVQLEKSVANLQGRMAATEAMLMLLADGQSEASRQLLINLSGQDQRELERLSGRVAHLKTDSQAVRQDTLRDLKIFVNTFMPKKFSAQGYVDSEQRWEYDGIRVRYDPNAERPLRLSREKVRSTISLERYVLALALVVKAEKLTGAKVLSDEERRDHTEFLTVRTPRPDEISSSRWRGGSSAANESAEPALRAPTGMRKAPLSLQEQLKPVSCSFSVDKYSAAADPRRNVPQGLCTGEVTCTRFGAISESFSFVKERAGMSCSFDPLQAPDSDRMAMELLRSEAWDPDVGSAPAHLMMAAAAHLNGRQWPPPPGGHDAAHSFDFTTRNVTAADLLAVSASGELVQFSFMTYEKKASCDRARGPARVHVDCQPRLTSATNAAPAPRWRQVVDVKEVARLAGWGAVRGAGTIYVDRSGPAWKHSVVTSRRDGSAVWRTVTVEKTQPPPSAARPPCAPAPRGSGPTGGRFAVSAGCLHGTGFMFSSIAPQAPSMTMLEKPLAWGPFATTFSGGRGIVYAIDDRGGLHWIKDAHAHEVPNGHNKGLRPSQPVRPCTNPAGVGRFARACSGNVVATGVAPVTNKIAEGWGGLRAVTSSGRGFIYALGQDGTLRLHHHLLFANDDRPLAQAARWNEVKTLASGWTGVRSMTSDMNGHLYVLTDSGELRFHKVTGFPLGVLSIAPAVVLRGDWRQYRYLFALNDQTERDHGPR